MARLKVAAAGNAEKNINRIDGRFQAEALRFLRGFDTGRLYNSFYSNSDPTGAEREENPSFNWRVEGVTADDITVGPGVATAYGYDIISEETVHFSLDSSSFGEEFYIYIEWDLGNPDEAVGKIEIRNVYEDDGHRVKLWKPTMQNLILNPNGIFQMVIARISINEDGGVSSIREASFPGADIWNQPLYALNSERAVHSENALYAEGKSDKTIAGYFNDIYQRIKDLGHRSSKVVLPEGGEAVLNEIHRQGNYVLLSLETYYEVPSSGWEKTVGIPGVETETETREWLDTSWTFTIPEFFRPKGEILFQTGAIGSCNYTSYHNAEWNSAVDGQITTDGKLILKLRHDNQRSNYCLRIIKLRLGWEANPI